MAMDRRLQRSQPRHNRKLWRTFLTVRRRVIPIECTHAIEVLRRRHTVSNHLRNTPLSLSDAFASLYQLAALHKVRKLASGGPGRKPDRIALARSLAELDALLSERKLKDTKRQPSRGYNGFRAQARKSEPKTWFDHVGPVGVALGSALLELCNETP